eukprot:813155-Prymnesium_polylepis.1
MEPNFRPYKQFCMYLNLADGIANGPLSRRAASWYVKPVPELRRLFFVARPSTAVGRARRCRRP